MKTNKMKTCVALLLVMLMAASIFTGCTGKPTDGKTGKEKKDLFEITVGVPSVVETLGYAHWLCAEYMGYFEEEGIKINMIPQSGADVCKMMIGKECDIAVPAPGVIFPALVSGIEMYVLFQNDCINIFGFAVKEDSGINDWSDLAGKSIATDASWYLFSDPILKSAGIEPEDVEYVSAPDERSVMLAAGTVDAAFTWDKEWQFWEAQGIPIRYLSGEDVLKNSANALVCTPEYYEAHKDEIARMGRALAKGIYFCEVNPLAAAKIVTERWPTLGLDPKDVESTMKVLAKCCTPTTGNYGEAELSRWEKSLEWLDYFDAVDADNVDLNALLKTSELLEAYNDWDKAAVEADARNIDIDTIKWK